MIRPATLDDEPAIRRCAGAAYTPYIALIGRAPAPMIADFAGLIARGAVHVGIDDEGRLEGFVVCYPDDGVMHLENVAVRAPGRGTGGRLIAHCEALARAAGLSAVTLYTNAAMTANLALYPHLGYRETGRGRQAGFERVFFRKELTGGITAVSRGDASVYDNGRAHEGDEAMPELRRIDHDEADSRLHRMLPHWSRQDDTIVRTYRVNGFRGAALAAGAIAHLAEVAWHHPDLTISYGKVVVRLTTHDVKGLSERDFALAERIEQVMGWRPSADGGPLEGVPEGSKALAYLIHD